MVISAQALNRILGNIDPGWTAQRLNPLSRRASVLHVQSSDNVIRRLILLTHGERDRAGNPHIARDEYRLLQSLRHAGLPVAEPLHLAEDHEPPFLVTSFIHGTTRFSAPDLPAYCENLADTLSAIHAIDLGRHDLAFLPRQTDMIEEYFGQKEDKIGSTMRGVFGGIKRNRTALLHGDFWLGNLLWDGGLLTGIIDWEDAMLGDPLADLGKSRLELLWALGANVMEIFTAQYLALNPPLDAGALPFWDLWGASRLRHFATFAPENGKIPQMQTQYDHFLDNAIRALDAS